MQRLFFNAVKLFKILDIKLGEFRKTLQKHLSDLVVFRIVVDGREHGLTVDLGFLKNNELRRALFLIVIGWDKRVVDHSVYLRAIHKLKPRNVSFLVLKLNNSLVLVKESIFIFSHIQPPFRA